MPKDLPALAQHLIIRVADVVFLHLPKRKNRLYYYLIAVLLMAVALLVRLMIAPVSVGLPYLTFFPAVTLAAVLGGYRPALLATAIGMALATFIFTPPHFSLSLEILEASFWPNLVFLFDGLVVAFSIEAMHRYRRQYEAELERVKASEAHEKALNGELAEHIVKRRKAEEALREADRNKDEFLATLAHELRNPLTPITLATHLLEQPQLDEAQRRWAIAAIADQAGHITRLVDDLLDVSRISRGRIELKREAVAFADLAARAVESVRPALYAKRHHFALRLPNGSVQLDADPVRLTQVLVNLLDNAAKYTPEGGHIELAARVAEGEIEITVRDDGTGMSADLLPHVFELFRQGERTLDRSQGGLGIGLSLVERLVRMHGGRIAAASPGPGRGSVFTVWLPIRATPAAPVAATPTPVASGLRVLVVDDDRLVAYGLNKMLSLHGHSVVTAAGGEEALEQVAAFRPQAILLDIGLVGMDGYETARRLRSQSGGGAFRLIALSGYGDAAARARSQEAGFDAYLVKPVDYRALAEELSRVEVDESGDL